MSNRIASFIPRAARAASLASSSASRVGGGSMPGIRQLATTQSSSAITTATGVRSASACSNIQSSHISMAASSPPRGIELTSLHYGSRLTPYLSYSQQCSSRVAPGDNTTSRVTSRAISSTRTLLDDDKKAAAADEANKADDDDDDPCPEWQNPLHHNNPDYQKILEEDFEPGEEMPIVPLPPFETEENEGKVLASPEVHALADEIIRLNMIEVTELCNRIGDHFGFDDDDGGFMMDGDGGGAGGGAAAEEVVEEKTVFDLKLTGFDAKSKIKVIKEVRAITSLGLKEAKELVEGAPTTVKKDIKKEEAEELKAKLEKVGATIDIV